jgi:hypothetical protein
MFPSPVVFDLEMERVVAMDEPHGYRVASAYFAAFLQGSPKRRGEGHQDRRAHPGGGGASNRSRTVWDFMSGAVLA